MPRRLTLNEFIDRAQSTYGDRYDYSKVDYKNSSTPVCIICPKHGEFWQIPNNHIRGAGCPTCANRQRIDTKVFLERAKKVHGDRYDYSKVICKGKESYVTIICPIHGEFSQKAAYHLNGNGCPKCFGTPKSNTKEFIEKAKKIYGDKYSYLNVDYQGNKVKVLITCPTHGDWLVSPNAFLRGSECPKCYGTPKYTTEEFIRKSKEIHGDKYDYSKVDYQGNKYKVCIICPIHGEFWQNAGAHLRGAGCSICNVGYRVFKRNGNSVSVDKNLFIKRSLETHTIKYDYSKVSLINNSEKVCIICPTHGEFWQIPNNHLYGAGCPTCPQSNMEGELREVLKKKNIRFEQEKGFPWLRYKKKMFLDFYLPDYNLAIECQGGQHFMPVDLFGGEDFYNKTLDRDIAKHDLCEEHGITILYFSKTKADYPYLVFETYKELLNEIKKHKSKKV